MFPSASNWQSWALASAFFAALTAILAKFGVQNVDPNLATAVRTTVVLVLTWSIVVVQGTLRVPTSIDGRALLFLTLSGLATGASWLCYFRALKLGPVSRVAPLDKLSVPIAFFLAALLLHEPVTWRAGLGVALITGGALLLIR